MKQSVVTQWVNDLRSGKFKQARHQLCSRDNGRHRRHCCLGVLAKDDIQKFEDGWMGDALGVVGDDGTYEGGNLSRKLRRKFGLTKKEMNKAIGLNDDLGLSFEQIANEIEAGHVVKITAG